MVPVGPHAGANESAELTATFPHASVPVAVPVAEGAVDEPHSTVTLAGQAMLGLVVSTIVIVWLHDAEWPQPSMTVQVRVMTPVFPQAAANASLLETVTLPHASLPVAEPVVAGVVGSPHSTVTLAGQLIVGFVVSTMVIVCTHVAVWLQASVAVQVRVITPVFPQPGANESALLIVTLPQVSDPVAVPVAAGDVDEPHSTVASSGHWIVGTVVSTIVMTWVQLEVWLQASVAVHVRVMTAE